MESDSDSHAPRDKSARSTNGSSSNRKGRREEFEDYSVSNPRDVPEGPDVLVDVPALLSYQLLVGP